MQEKNVIIYKLFQCRYNNKNKCILFCVGFVIKYKKKQFFIHFFSDDRIKMSVYYFVYDLS